MSESKPEDYESGVVFDVTIKHHGSLPNPVKISFDGGATWANVMLDPDPPPRAFGWQWLAEKEKP